MTFVPTRILLFALLTCLTLFLTSCGMIQEIIEIVTEEEEDPLDIYEDEPRRQDVRDYTFYKVHDLVPLKNGHYEAWIYQENAFISTGKFNINRYKTTVKSSGPIVDVGRITDLKGNTVMDGRFENKEAFNHPEKVYISIEPNGDEDSIPSLFLLAGDIEKRRASLDLNLIDRSKLSGTVRLGNCVSGDCTSGSSGLWFFKDSKDKEGRPVKVSSLKMPPPPEGFIYEVWVRLVIEKEEVFVSLGKFSDPAEPDLDSSWSGGKQGPAFPGDDLLELTDQAKQLAVEVKVPVRLIAADTKVLLTLQPYINGEDQTPDTPFPVHLLEAELSGKRPGSDVRLKPSTDPLPTADLFIR